MGLACTRAWTPEPRRRGRRKAARRPRRSRRRGGPGLGGRVRPERAGVRTRRQPRLAGRPGLYAAVLRARASVRAAGPRQPPAQPFRELGAEDIYLGGESRYFWLCHAFPRPLSKAEEDPLSQRHHEVSWQHRKSSLPSCLQIKLTSPPFPLFYLSPRPVSPSLTPAGVRTRLRAALRAKGELAGFGGPRSARSGGTACSDRL